MDKTFLVVAAIGLLAVISPGPDFLIVTRNSLLFSKKVGLATAWGIAAGNLWWVVASILGISLVISQTVLLFNILKWLGALYLIYLGVKSLFGRKKSDRSLTMNGPAGSDRPGLSAWGAFRIGLITNVSNPKCALFFVSFFSVVVAPDTPVALRLAYGAEIMLISICWFSVLATILSAPRIRAGFERFSLWFDRVTGAILIALGVKVALYQQR
jgi:RhtB (resistance to homoserine/threonine) family protein